jgi:hypothetical protein
MRQSMQSRMLARPRRTDSAEISSKTDIGAAWGSAAGFVK